ncbi:MAG: hypothetical protein QOJ50_594, partial [Cryptosporangiaceae bacterium]|nr:hypothetical protein [Cryptosporangiaceae bacterium]
MSLFREHLRPRDRSASASPLLIASGIVAVILLIWYGIQLYAPVGPRFLVWIPGPVSAILAAVLCAQNAATEPNAQYRRFWRGLATSVVLVGLGGVAGAVDALTHPPAIIHRPPWTSIACYVAAMGLLLWRLYRLPVAAETSGDRLRVWLDAATVMLGTGLFVWHFLMLPTLADPHGGSTSIFMLGLLLMAVFAGAKVALSSGSTISNSSLWLFGAALLSGGLAAGPQQSLLENTRLNSVQYAIPMVLFFIAWAADRQRRANRLTGVRVRNPFSVLPYAAVVIVDGLLMLIVWTNEPQDLRVVAIGAVVLTVLVVVRQASAFRENGRLLARLHHGATHDALTQLPNRALFAERLQDALTNNDSGRPLSVALIDLDDFKLVNDALGHGVGDTLLVEIGKRLLASICPQDTVARLGGDEFVVVLDGTDPTGADIAVDRILSSLSVPVLADGHELLVSASIGIADGRSGADAAELLRQADVAMYAAKKQGGAGFLHYEPGMTGGPADNAHLGAELRLALAAGDQLFLEYQPIVALDGGLLAGV